MRSLTYISKLGFQCGLGTQLWVSTHASCRDLLGFTVQNQSCPAQMIQARIINERQVVRLFLIQTKDSANAKSPSSNYMQGGLVCGGRRSKNASCSL